MTNFEEVQDYSTNNDVQILDSRPPPAFAVGEIPSSINVAFQHLTNEDGTIKSDDDLRAVFDKMGVDPGKKSVSTCMIGMSACILDLSLRILGNENAQLYDGSWMEYSDLSK